LHLWRTAADVRLLSQAAHFHNAMFRKITALDVFRKYFSSWTHNISLSSDVAWKALRIISFVAFTLQATFSAVVRNDRGAHRSTAYRLTLLGVKRPGRGVNHPSLFRDEVKERVELYLYSSSVPSWHVTRWTPLHSYLQLGLFKSHMLLSVSPVWHKQPLHWATQCTNVFLMNLVINCYCLSKQQYPIDLHIEDRFCFVLSDNWIYEGHLSEG
jgi:hypothetical protein